MEFRKNSKYALMSPTSMGVRITPFDRQPVHTSNLFQMQATSAESNVLSISAALGLKTKVLTKFVKDSPIALLIKSDLRRRGIDFEGKEIEQDGPWGYRHQFNIADSGYGMRGPRVSNDRAGEVGKTMSLEDFDLERIFKEDGVDLLHLSGLIVALSKETSQFCLNLARYAKQYGTKISFDLNYRASFWKNRREELLRIFKEIASVTDVLIGNEEDYQLALDIQGPKAGGKDIKKEIDNFKGLIHSVRQQYPNASAYATTLREVEDANKHQWGAILYYENAFTVIEPRPISVLDRIGGGDGFVGGLLYGFLRGFEPKQCAEFAWATGAYVTTVKEDFGLPVDEQQIWNIWEGNARVKR
ncbi:MAG: sugar kinase [Acholeplasma sp.]|nr:sugar kinase [Acholeplasma sp.]